MLSSASDKAKLFPEIFSKNSNHQLRYLFKGLQLKTTTLLVFFLWLVKSLKKLLNTVVSDRIGRAFNKYGATQATALDVSKAFGRVWHAGLLHKLKSYRISGQIFDLISSFLQ